MSQAQGQGVQVPIGQQKSPVAIAIGNYLKDNKILKERTGLLNNKDDIDFFKYKRFTRALLSDDYKNKQKNPKNGLPVVENELEAQKVFVTLIQNQMVLPIEKLHYAEIKSIRGWKPNRTKPTFKRIDKADLSANSYYGWLYTKPNPYILLYSVLTLVGIFAVILFPLWPVFMRTGVWYISMGLLGLIVLFFVIAIIRLIIYVISLVAFPKPFWLFPNLFEDCGVIESFQPLYGWEEPKKSKGKGKKAKKVQGGTESSKATATSTGASSTSGSATKRKVTLEEVDE